MTNIDCDQCRGKGGWHINESYKSYASGSPRSGCHQVYSTKYRKKWNKCNHCNGTGKLHIVQVTDWCDTCNGTGEVIRSQEIYKTYKTGRKLPTGEYKKWRESCYDCNGSGKKKYNQTRMGTAPKKEGCYITTAVCQEINPDKSEYILERFRTYRDTWLAQQKNGEQLIAQYYIDAPKILESLGKNKKEILKKAWEKHLKRCLILIEDNKNEDALSTYVKMVSYLKIQVQEENGD